MANSLSFQRASVRPGARQRGMTLIELMVGLVIGMIAVIVMIQVFSLSDSYKRIATGGDDAQNAGAITLYGLQRDLRESGFGLNSYGLVGCNLTLRPGVVIPAATPVTINHPSIPAGDAGTDTLLLAYATTVGAGEGERITAQPANTTYSVFAASAFRQGDRVIAQATPAPAMPCATSIDTVSAAPVTPNVSVTTGATGMSPGVLFNLGQAPQFIAYRVSAGNLLRCDYSLQDCSTTTAAAWVPVAGNVVSLQALYGKDTSVPMDGAVDANGWDRVNPTTTCGWLRVSALRFALVVRSSQFDKDIVTPAAPTWTGPTGVPSAIDLTGTNADWNHYRYKVFETLTPMRNMAWALLDPRC